MLRTDFSLKKGKILEDSTGGEKTFHSFSGKYIGQKRKKIGEGGEGFYP